MWIINKIKQFFYFTVGMSVLSLFNNMMPLELKNSLVAKLESQAPKEEHQAEVVQPVGQASLEAVPAETEPGGKKSDQPLVLPSGKSMFWKGQRYVLIQGKWYLEREDHTYTVNGVRTYFKDDSKVGVAKEASQKVKDGTASAGGSAKAVAGTGLQKAQDLLKKVATNPFTAYSPQTMKEMSEAMEAAKAAITQHNKELEELAK